MTQRCNLQCSYCGSECVPSLMPINLSFTTRALQSFFDQDDEQPNIAFYGGEPFEPFEPFGNVCVALGEYGE